MPFTSPIASEHPGRSSHARLLGELLVERGIVSAADVHKALAFQDQYGGRIGSILVRLGALSEKSLLPVLSDQLGVPLLAGSEWPEPARYLVVVVATPNHQIQGLYQIVNPDKGSISNHVLVRPGSN